MKTHAVTQFKCYEQQWKLLKPMQVTAKKHSTMNAYECYDNSGELIGSSPSDRFEDVTQSVMSDLGATLNLVCEPYLYPSQSKYRGGEMEIEMRELIGESQLLKAIEAGRKWLIIDNNNDLGLDSHPCG